MKKTHALALLLVLGCSSAMVASSKVTPVQKVIELLNGMLEKGKKEKHDEQVQYAAFKQFCDDTIVDKKRAIEEAEEQIEILKADIQKYTVTIETVTKEIAEHESDIATWTGDIKAATKVRKAEKADYDDLYDDYSESIDALERAIAVLKKQAYDRAQSDKTVGKYGDVSLSQVANLKKFNLIPDEAKRAIDTFLAQDPDALLEQAVAPEANAYEFQSQPIIDMLEKLLGKFKDELRDLEKEEANAQHAYDLLVEDLTAQIEQAKNDVASKTQIKVTAEENKAKAEGDLEDTKASMEADIKYVADLEALCEQKAKDFEDRQELRAEELEALEKAIEIIESQAVKGNAEKHLPTLLQVKGALAQLRADTSSPNQRRVAEYLRSQGEQLNSRILTALAVHVEDDPFGKVKKMIKDLITRLMEEAAEEAEHKGWCDTELATNEETRKEKTKAVEELHAEIDELEADIAKLGEEIVALTKEVAELEAAIAKATTIRQEEKEKNTETIKDAQEAQTAVAEAITILKEFYAKAGEATALIQQQPTPPPVFDSPYKGMQAESGGVIGMLEVIESDFARLETETKAAEATAQKEYDEFLTDSEVDKASKSKDIEHKSAKKQDEEQALVMKKEDLDGTQKELEAALGYFDKLKPSCVDAGVSYDDRIARRKEEIESLQEALRILNGEDIA